MSPKKQPEHLWAGDWQTESAEHARHNAVETEQQVVAAEPEATVAPPVQHPRWHAPKPRRMVAAAAMVATVAVGGYLVSGIGDDSSTSRIAALPVDTTAAISPGQNVAARIYAKASPAVVSVRTGDGSGTGFVIDSDGTIVTNAHVVDSANRVTIRFGSDGQDITGKVVGTDTSSDLAVIKIDPSSIPSGVTPLTFADSDKVEVGDSVLAIGNPFGLDRTQTAGIISALGRDIQAPNGFQISGALQTDAAINPGNSGGPLLDTTGRVVGVNSQIETGSDSSGNVGIGFAVPSNIVRQVVPTLEQGKTVRHAWLGVSTQDASSGAGAEVGAVSDGSPAANAGLRQGDVIIALDSKPISGSEALVAYVNGAKTGDTIKIHVRRGGRSIDLEATLRARPSSTP